MTGNQMLAAYEGNPDLIVVAGGDGTIRLLLGALSDAGSKTPVGIVPLGTGNQLARNLGFYEPNLLTDSIDDALNVIVEGNASPIDLGRMNGEYFCIAAGVGPLSDAVSQPSSKDKANLKMLAYIGSIVLNLGAPPVVFHVKVEEEEGFDVTASGIFITNVSDLGMGTLSHTASLNDGWLDLCILSPAELPDYITMGFGFASGFFGGPAPYYIRKVRKAEISVLQVESPLSGIQSIAYSVRSALQGKAGSAPIYAEVPASVDGDIRGTTPVLVEVVPGAVNVLRPR
jgi:diacylglycerol kinase family enzyme